MPAWTKQEYYSSSPSWCLKHYHHTPELTTLSSNWSLIWLVSLPIGLPSDWYFFNMEKLWKKLWKSLVGKLYGYHHLILARQAFSETWKYSSLVFFHAQKHAVATYSLTVCYGKIHNHNFPWVVMVLFLPLHKNKKLLVWIVRLMMALILELYFGFSLHCV